MKSKFYKSNIEIINSLRLISEQDDEYYKISAKDLEQMMELSGYAIQVTRLPKFGGKKLHVVGNLNLSDSKIKNLGNIGYVEGNLDISHTNISSLGDVKVKGYVSDWSTPLRRIREQKELQDKKDEQNSLREDNEWDLNNPNIDEIGLKANALFQYLVENGDADYEGTKKRKEIENEIKELESTIDSIEDEGQIKDMEEKITELQDELDTTVAIDVYDIMRKKYNFYGNLTTFEILDPDFKDQEYTVGTSDEMDSALEEYFESYVDDVGLDGFNKHFIEDCLDTDAIEQMFRDHYEDIVREEPESYFSDTDFILTDEQEKRIEQLEKYIEEMEQLKSDLEEQKSNLENEIEEPDEYSKKYDEVQEKIDEIEENITKAQDEIDETEPDREPTEDMIEEKVDEIVGDMMDDPAQSLKDWGIDVKDYVDKDDLVQKLCREEDWGQMNGYDSSYDSVYINDRNFYVMRVS